MIDVPDVTVVVLNYNGLRHLAECFSSLRRLDYPKHRLHLMLVDNGSSDDSIEFVRDSYPDVKIVCLPANLGFGHGNNAGAEAAGSRFVVFLNNDMRVDRGFIRGFVAAAETRPEAVCFGAKIVSWDGRRIDFGGAALHFAGHGYQEGHGERVAPGTYDTVESLLFACGGAMMIDREVFLDVGGFDGDFFALYEDVDLGWRLWILGYEVVFAPQAVVYHHHHGTLDSFADHRKRVLYKRNAFSSLVKNYDDENLGRLLSAALLGTVGGIVDQAVRTGRLDLAQYDISSFDPGRPAPLRIEPPTVSTLVAMRELTEMLPSLLEKRAAIQARRRRSDVEIAELFRSPFRHWPDVDPHVQYRVAHSLGVDALFASVPRRVLVVSPDLLPYPGLPTVGSGLRAWGIAHGLATRGHEVVLSMPTSAVRGYEDRLPRDVLERAWDPRRLHATVSKTRPDVVVVCGWPLMDALSGPVGVPVVLDQAGPHLLEREYQGAGDPRENAASKLRAFAKADFFTSSGEIQHAYFDDWLARAGWKEAERRQLTAVIPYSLDPDLPEHEFEDELAFAYGGIFLPWQDPSVALLELVTELQRRDRGKLYFFGGDHPWGGVEAPAMKELAERLRTSPRVVVSGFLPYDEILRRYARAHVAVDLMKRNRERELAFTTRTVVYLWCGLPVIYNNYSELSGYIADYDAGWTVDPEDRRAIRTVLEEIFDDSDVVRRKSRNAQRLVRERLTWDRTVDPLDEFVRHPWIRRDRHDAAGAPGPVSLASAWEQVRQAYLLGGVREVGAGTLRVTRRRLAQARRLR